MSALQPVAERPPERGEARARRPELSALMSLRFVAAIGVFLLHVSNVTGASLYPGVSIAGWPSWLQVMHEGYYRQTFFLMLSGFVLTYVYASRIDRGFGRTFYVRRIARIWPLHMLMLIAMLPGAADDLLVAPVRMVIAFVANATLLHGWFPAVQASADANFAVAYNGPSWALSCELAAYFAFPVLAALLVPRLRAAGAIAAAVALWLVVATIGMAATQLPDHQTAVELVYTFPAARLLDFTIGILLGIAFAGWIGREQARGRETWGSGGRSAWWTALELGCVALLVLAIANRSLAPDAFRLVAWYMPIIGMLLFVFACGRGLVSSLLSRRPLVALGRVSFAFYIVHFPLLVYARVLLGFGATSVWSVALLFGVTLAIAVALNRYVENQSRDAIVAWDARRTERRRARAATVTSIEPTPASVDAGSDERDSA